MNLNLPKHLCRFKGIILDGTDELVLWFSTKPPSEATLRELCGLSRSKTPCVVHVEPCYRYPHHIAVLELNYYLQGLATLNRVDITLAGEFPSEFSVAVMVSRFNTVKVLPF